MIDLIESLSAGERKIIPFLQTGKTVTWIAEKAGTDHVEAMRACQFLSNKEVVSIEQKTETSVELTKRGEEVLKKGFPEERLINNLNAPAKFKDLAKISGLDKKEVNAAVGRLRREGAIEVGKEVVRLKKPSFTVKKRRLEGKKADKEFIQRGLIEKNIKTQYIITVSELGEKLKKQDLGAEKTGRVTSSMLKTGKWKGADFRSYDVTAKVPKISYGRKHFVTEAVENIKQIWVELGFTEMTGNYAQTAFWDLDALFVPQDHPAREMQDTFYLKTRGKLPKFWKDVKKVHEKGGNTKSDGWQYEYSEEEARKVLLRTHTTVLSAQMLKQLTKKDLPGKYFSVAKVFRNETLDWKHLFEFHQVEGIVVGEKLTLNHLKALATKFYNKMGFEKIRFRPAYFPYTEPSAEVEVYHPKKKQWVELGGMGVFRPEVVKPLLGEDVPVLAWGLGMERIITDYYGIKDLREIYNNDVQQLREAKHYI